MIIAPKPGVMMDQPPVTPKPVWTLGYNIRFRLGMLETIGLFGPLQTDVGDQVVLSGGVYRRVFTTLSTTTGQILFGSADAVQLVDYDPASTPATGTRWRQVPVTPAALPAASDIIPNPSAGKIEIPPVWWFSDQDDVVVGCRANVALEPCYVWDRNRATPFAAIAGSPLGAVGGGILNRILILIGCTSFTDPDPARQMTIRWSDRFNFEDWTPTDINLSGEFQLEGGSRIVGGGVVGFGVVAWTDKRMALLVETFDLDSVFSRKYIDGGRGLLANNAWTEADGQVWWFDESRTLNKYDGGRPVQIPNPLKYATLERLQDSQVARAYMEPNPEFGEVILHYPDVGSDEPDTQLIYNYLENAWSIWRLPRTGWAGRVGVIRNIGVDLDGAVWQHDLDAGLPDVYITGPPLQAGGGIDAILPKPGKRIPSDEVEAFSWMAASNLVTDDSVTMSTWSTTRLHCNYLRAPADGVLDDITIQVTGYGEAQVENTDIMQDARIFAAGDTSDDFRVAGKALQISVYGEDVKTVTRISNFAVTEGKGGQR